MAGIFVAEIGDGTRFPTARYLCSWAGVTPRVRDSDETPGAHHQDKQGSGLLRWAAVEAGARYHGGDPHPPRLRRIADRRGKMIAWVAAARRPLTLVYAADCERACPEFVSTNETGGFPTQFVSAVKEI
jgi:transposase